MQHKGYSLLAVAVSAALAGQAFASTPQKTIYSPEYEGIVSYDTAVKNKINLEERPHYFIVQLENAPLAEAVVSAAPASASAKGNRLDMSSAAATKHSAVLAAERNSFTQNLKKALPDAQVERHYDTVFNGVVVTSQDDIFEKLSALPGVTKVFREEMYYEQMDASLSLINARQVWEQLGGSAEAGKGIKVAVIDGGIRPENPMFRDDGMAAPAHRPTDDYCATIQPDFCNNKLIVARYSAPTFATIEQEYMSPLGQGGHGTHVAGTVLGMPTTIYFNGSGNTDVDGEVVTQPTPGYTQVEVSGVAPGAYLMAYKALFQVYRTTNGVTTVTGSGSNVMLLEALDWAVKDGADVINNSWGGGAGGDPAASPYLSSFHAAEAAGVVVVTAAGNDGPAAKTIGCPSCIESGISVASTTHGRYFANKVSVGGSDYLAIAGSTFAENVQDLTADVVAPVVFATDVAPDNALGCTAFPADAFKDKIAVISRGTCAFSDKANNAAAAGAIGLIVIQNSDGAPSIMSTPGITIPAVMISKADGAKLAEAGDAAVTISITADRVVSAQFADIMSDFSSRGPNGNSSFLKPDIGAPGSSILSATSPDAFADSRTFQLNSGTSMASPHVAGAAAIMKQLYPEWTPVEIKTALTSTAVNGLKKEDAVTPTTPFDIGAGRLDLQRASKAGVTFDKPSFAQDPCVGECTFTRTIRNMTDKEVTWTPSLDLTDPAMTGEFSVTSVTLKPYGTEGDSAEFSLKLNGNFAALDSWSFGNVLWTASDSAIPSATMPIAVRVAMSSDSSAVSTVASGELTPSTPAAVVSTFNNKTFTGQISVVSKLPAGTKLVEGSGAVAVNNGTQYLFDANEAAGTVAWSGALSTPSMQLSASSFLSGFTVAATGGSRVACTGECDEFYTSLNLGGAGLPVTFNGQTYNRVYLSDNGIINFTNGTTAPSPSYANQQLPSGTAPNNLIAPFWTDLDLTGGSTGGGDLYYGVYTVGTVRYLVVEWNKVQVYADTTGKEYTFQAWMALNAPQDIFFNYVDMAAMPADVTVGAEDLAGTLGVTRYYNGTGTAPASSSALDLVSVGGGKLTMNYQLENTGELALGKADTIAVDEDSVSEAIDVMANDASSFQKVVQVKVTNNGQTQSAFNKLTVKPEGALSAPVVVSAPAQGTVTVTEGKFVYTPAANFNGTDSFTYQSEDEAGVKTVPTTVTVNVAAVNDAPTLTAGAAVTANEGASATLSVTGADVDGDPLTYTWTQVSGPTIAINATTASVTVTAPAVTASSSAVFSVVASDGTLSSAPVQVTLNVTDVPEPKKSSGGSSGWLTLLLLPLALLRRRK
ncbi:S8 family serine peptidase [Rheinheimera sp.]|uniref:S8 family serine peptidase n=1 Tax=Rheinheimera sp. TaxID=1869214 RepID=UPI00307F549D